MRLGVFLIFIILFSCRLYAQTTVNYTLIDKKILQIPDSMTLTSRGIASYVNQCFSRPEDKSRAIFCWITTHIRYDIENMYALNSSQDVAELTKKTLKTRRGICMNYAELFKDIATRVGIKTIVISGYTRHDGVVATIPHSWCAALIDSHWFLFDPTWGAGYVLNNKFVRQINNSYFRVEPEKLIKSHIPFDPLWQFLNYPITNQEFLDGKVAVKEESRYFNFVDTLIIYEKQSEFERIVSSGRRIAKNGVVNALIFDRIQHNKREIEYFEKTKAVGQYNDGVKFYNEGVNSLNQFINYRNRQFTPAKADSTIKQMLYSVSYSLDQSRENLAVIKNPDSELAASMTQLFQSIKEASASLEEQRIFLDKYFKTGKLFRKSLFFKYSWMGMPLN